MNQIKKGQLEQYDYYCRHKERIERSRRQILGFLWFLKRSGIISYFETPQHDILHRDHIVRFKTNVKFNHKISQYISDMVCVFRIGVEKEIYEEPKVYVRIRHSLKELHVSLPRHFSYEECLVLLRMQLAKQNNGIRSERLFLDEFLTPLSKHSDEIAYVHYAGTRNDLRYGVDFVVGYKPHMLTNIFPINFQLKSSNQYSETHKEKYPDVGLFVFKPKFLKNYDRLAFNFFKFLNQSMHEVTIWRA